MTTTRRQSGGRRRRALWAPTLFSLVLAMGCAAGSDGTSPDPSLALSCSIPSDEIFNGGPGKDGIPALTNPATTTPGGEGIGYLRDDDRVMGIQIGDEVLAIPLNILWWHEIVNLDLGGRRLAVTHCPLTGSSLVFDREPLGGVEFGVSGLLFRNNLLMYDRSTGESLWPQMARGARCGPRDGTGLAMFPVLEMTWEGWRTLHPGTRVVTSNTGFGRDYRVYPYGDYDDRDNGQLLFPIDGLDPRRPPKERILGVPTSQGGRAFPFGELSALGPVAAVHDGGSVVFWDEARQAAMAYSSTLDGAPLTFEAGGTAITDTQTGSVWSVDGRAVTGPLAGRSLDPVAEAYVAYWFAWAVFHPDTQLWSAS